MVLFQHLDRIFAIIFFIIQIPIHILFRDLFNWLSTYLLFPILLNRHISVSFCLQEFSVFSQLIGFQECWILSIIVCLLVLSFSQLTICLFLWHEIFSFIWINIFVSFKHIFSVAAHGSPAWVFPDRGAAAVCL